MNVLFID